MRASRARYPREADWRVGTVDTSFAARQGEGSRLGGRVGCQPRDLRKRGSAWSYDPQMDRFRERLAELRSGSDVT